MNEMLSTNLENLVNIRPENLASVCGHYVGLVQSMLTVYLKRDSYRQVVGQIAKLVSAAVNEVDLELVAKLCLNPRNPTHAHYVTRMPVIFLIDSLKDYAEVLSRGFVNADPDYSRLECAISEGWKRLNGCGHWVRAPGAEFEMKSSEQYEQDGFGSFNFRLEMAKFVTQIGKVQQV